MSCDNNNVECVKNITNLSDEKTIDLNGQKSTNKSNFWEVFVN